MPRPRPWNGTLVCTKRLCKSLHSRDTCQSDVSDRFINFRFCEQRLTILVDGFGMAELTWNAIHHLLGLPSGP